MRPSASALLERTVRGDKGCRLWTGSLDTRGYAHTSFNGKTRRVHRVIYTLEVGPIPRGMQVDHTCRVRNCIEPRHLRLATNKLNQENRPRESPGSASGIRGITKGTRNGWRVRVRIDGVMVQIGTFPTLELAEEALVAKRNQVQIYNEVDR